MSSRWLSNAAFFGLARKSSASRAWHWPQTNATDSSPGGCAPWLPWQSLQVGADRSSRLEQELGMHASPPARVLVDRQRSAVREPVSGHPRRVRMAAAARLRHAPRVHGGRDVRRRQDAVRAVAVDAGRDLRVALLQQLAVPARPVLALLVDPRAGLEALHERRVGVTAAAERRDLRPLRRAAEGVRRVLLVHRLQGLRQRRVGVAAVAVVTGKTGPGVRTALLVLDDRGRRLARDLGVRVADGAGRGARLGRRGRPRRQQHRDDCDEAPPPHPLPPFSCRSIAREKSQTKIPAPSTA